MIRPAALIALLLGALAFVAVFVLLDPAGQLGQLQTERPGATPRPDDGPSDELVQDALLIGAAVATILAFMIGVPLTVLGALRMRVRRRRPMVRHWVLPFRSDEADHEAARRLVESWHQQLLAPWYWRPLRGQPPVTLEIVTEPDGQGGLEGRILVGMPEELVGALAGSLRACYPDSHLLPREAPLPPTPHLMRLKKRHAFIQALRVPDTEHRNVADALLAQMAALGEPAIVQLSLLPTPALFERRARRLFRAHERRLERPRDYDRANPGLRSEVIRTELEGGMAIQHRPLFFADVRIGAATPAASRALAGVLQGESAGENRLMDWPMGGKRFHERLTRAWANPLPDPRWGVLSSSEVAALWHLPSPSLTAIALRRSSVPRIAAAPEITREPRHALVRDERGPVGILPQDKSDGLGLIGGQKTGKTSVLCQTVRVDALDDDRALIVLMPKPGDARLALSMIPEHRTVHYLDFEQPEFGINPLLAPGDAGMVADKIVEAFRDVNEEGDIKGSSDRFLRQSAQAAIAASRAGALDVPPNLWHMYRMLLPSETAFREHVVGAIYGDPRFTDTATFFGRDLPNDLRDATVNTTSKLDAPRNKILRLMVESLDKVLRHPVQLSIDDVIRRREVLIVDGKMGTFGSDNCRVMMQFILSMLYGALQRQQQLPEAERTRVALKVDEAHLVINDSFADALATLRSAGLEVVAAWQYGEQIQDPKLRAGMMSLLRQRCMFSMGESTDAREMSDIAMTVYTDLIKDDVESRRRVRLTPDVIFNLPNHRALCSWIADGARRPAFLAETVPLDARDEVVASHLDRQRERGGHVPERLPTPLPAFGEDAVEAPATLDLVGSAVRSENGNGARPQVGAPETYTELDLDGVRDLVADDVEVGTPHEPSSRELEILAALSEHRHLLASQIHRRWWAGSSVRAAQQGLTRMARAGWVRRLKLVTNERGAQQRVYRITQAGFELAQRTEGSRGPYIKPDVEWAEPSGRDMPRDVHVVGWVSALQTVVPKAVRSWKGAAASRLVPPRRRERGEWVTQGPADVPVGGNRRLRDAGLDRLQPVAPAATVEIRVPSGDRPVRFDLLVELDRSRGASYNDERLKRYDLLIAGWYRMLPRYQSLGVPPVVVFVCEDERRALAHLRTADKAVTTRVAEAGTPESEWPCPTRRHMFFVVERDLHEGSLEALALPELPPDVRVRLEGEDAAPCAPRRVQLVDHKAVALTAGRS